jgi:lipopolysaccharide export system protein LptA
MISMFSSSRLCGPGRQLAAIAFAVSFGAAFGASAQSSVQGVPNAMQGFSQNRDQPIQIEAASLEMRDKKKEATFSGNVKVVQGDTTMTSKTLVVFYESSGQGQGQGQGQQPAPAKGAKTAAAAPAAPMQSATPGPGGSSSIKRLEAHGNVVVTQKDQVVTGETAVFDTKTNLITMLGGVVLTQCKNVLRGDRLFVDMTTGVSRVESDSGKVQGLFINQGGGGCEGAGAAPGPGTGATPSPAPATGAKPGAGSPLSILNPNKPK